MAATDPEELRGLRELHDALLARRKKIAIEVATMRDSFRERGNFEPDNQWKKAGDLIEIDEQAKLVAKIIDSLTV